MDLSKIIFSRTKFHFIGIGGVSMSALAKYLIGIGKNVSGSDLTHSKYTDELECLGAKIYIGHSADNLTDSEVVVYNSAISSSNPELNKATQNDCIIIKRSLLLGCISSFYKRTVGIAGSHGKTTATAMLSNVLAVANLNPTCFIGGDDAEKGNFVKGDGDYCVYEACEYKGNFLDLNPYIAVVLNVDVDHLDSYGDENNIVSAFKKYASDGLSLVNLDDVHAKEIMTQTSVTFALCNEANYTAKKLVNNNGCYSFTAYSSKKMGKINLKIAGKHNVYNALAVIATADMLGVEFYKIKKGLESFNGVKRRQEYLGEICGVKAYADYAHHPKEIVETIKVFNNPLVIFQPHTYTRTEYLMEEFVNCLKNCNKLIIYKTYPAREVYSESGSAMALYKNLKKHGQGLYEYAENPEQLTESIKKIIEKESEVVFFGAGDIYEISLKIINGKNCCFE